MNPNLQLSQDITNIVNDSFISWEMLEKVSPVTRELLHFWFDENWTINRNINFHEGQKQAILNTIYLTEILKIKNVADIYKSVSPDLILEKSIWLKYIESDRFDYKRLCYKMATGTGKTWVLSALLIWQYLNYKYQKENDIFDSEVKFSSNFLVVAPWLIVYERLLDAFSWKIVWEKRDFSTSDFKNFQDLFIPEDYRESVFSFVQSSIVTKEEIGRKIIWDGQIIITNWHIFLENEEITEEDFENIDIYKETEKVIKSLLPATPWISAWNSLETLDNKYSSKPELEYLKRLKNLVVFNDEAHHLWESNSKTDDEEEKKWQQAMIDIAKNKKEHFLQLDFTATPYIQKWKEKQYFPHIIVDFDIVKAMKQWLIKSLVLDKRKEIATLSNDELEFKAVRENGKVISLSKWQEIMLQAWLKKLKILNDSFTKDWKNKTPKMLVVCEDTEVVPFVEKFLVDLWYNEDEFVSIHSNKKWDMYDEDKKKVFWLDIWENPKVVISVLMLREWFDVNNICVIVPLRSSTSWVLLEQTIWRWLRLMWRWDQALDEAKAENRKRLFQEKKSPNNYYDILSVVEHPAFEEFYRDLMNSWEIAFWIDENELDEKDREKITWEIETISLKSDYKDFDIAFPLIMSDIEEILKAPEYSINALSSYPWDYKELKKMVGTKEKFIQEAVLSGTRFWDYDVDIGILTANSYNEYLARLTRKVADAVWWGEFDIKKNSKNYNLMQINLPQITRLNQEYIENKLFSQKFEPLEDNNWKILMIDDIAKFIIKELIQIIENAKQVETIWEIQVINKYLSEVDSIKLRENFSIPVSKSIFEKLPFPSNKWWLEEAFIRFVDNESLVESFCKIFEFKHLFFRMRYIRDDGIPSYYYPDFILKTDEKIYLVETKATRDMNNQNVRRKENATLSYLRKINDLPPNFRQERIWEYVLLSEDKFYIYTKNNANIKEILESSKILDLKGNWNQVAFF